MPIDEKTIKKMMDILKSNPKDIPAFKALEEQYYLSHNWKKLCELYQFRADAIRTEDSAEAARLFFKSGEIKDKRFGSIDEAVAAYQNAFNLQPRKQEYGEPLVNLFFLGENWQKALEVLRRQLEFLQGEQRIPNLLRMAHIFKDQLQNHSEAKNYFEQVLQLQDSQQEAYRNLEELYYQDKQWNELINLYQVCLQAGCTSEEKIRLLESSALLCREQLQDWPRAIQYYNELLKITPGDFKTLKALEDLHTRLEQWNHVVDVLGRQFKLLENTESQNKLLVHMATIWSERLHNLPEAVRCYEKAMEIHEDDSILSLLEDIYFSQKNWRNLAVIYEKQAAREQDSSKQIELYSKIGALGKERLQDDQMAISWYLKAYESQGKTDLELLKLLQELYRQTGKIDKLIDACYQEIALISDNAEKISIYNKIVAIYREQKKLQEAAGVYEKLLVQFPGHRPSIEQLKMIYLTLEDYPSLLRAMEKQIALDPKSPENISLYLKMADILKQKIGREEEAIACYCRVLEIDRSQLDVWQKLYDYYQQKQHYPQLVHTLENIVQLNHKQAEKSWLEIAVIYQKYLKNIEKAIEAFKKVLEINSRNLTAIRALAAIYEHLQMWEPYIEMALARIDLCLDAEETIELRSSLAQVYQRLQRYDQQELQLLAILKGKFDHRPTVEQLKQLYEQQQNWVKYVRTLEREAQIFCWDSNELIRRYCQIGELLESRIKDSLRAIHFYERSRHLAPNDEEILDILERLYTEASDYRNLIKILTAKAQLCTDEAVVNAYHYHIAMVWEEKLQNEEEAIRSLQKVVAADLKNSRALQRLARLYENRQQYQLLVEIYQKQSYSTSDLEQKIALCLQCGKIWEDKLNHADQAAIHYAQVVELDEGNLDAVNRLLYIYRQKESWAALAPVYEKKIAISKDNEEILRLSFELATVYRDHLQSTNKAVEVYNRILSLDPANLQAVYALKDLYARLGNWKALEDVIKIECNLTGETEKKKSLSIQMGQLCEEKHLDFARAIEHYLAVLKYDPQHVEALRSLRRLYYKNQNYERVVWTIDQELAIDPNNVESITLLFEKGDLCNQRLLEFAKAIDAFENIITLDHTNIKAYQELNAVHRQRSNYQELVGVLTRLIAISPVEKQKKLWLECAKIWQDYLKNHEDAKKCLCQALELAKDFQPARRALENIYRNLGQWQELIELHRQEIAFCQDKSRLSELFYLIGKIQEINLEKNTPALSCYLKVLELDPDNLLAIKSLQKIYREEENYEKLLTAYHKELAVTQIENKRRIALHLACAELQRDKVNDSDGAVKHYLAVLDFQLDPNNLIAIRGLEDLYEEQEKYKELQSMFFKELELQKDAKRLISVHLQLGIILEEKLEDFDVAIEHYSEAHLSRPSNLPILRRLKNLLRQRNRWEEYADIVEKEIALCSTTAELLPLHHDLLDVYASHLHSFDKAIGHGEAILQLQANNLPALLKLESLYDNTNQSQKLVNSYLKEISLISEASDVERMIFLYLECGNLLANKMNNLAASAECYQKVLAN